MQSMGQGGREGGVGGVVFLDLAKAFDMVDHSILCSKLTRLGFRYGSVCWVESYLNDRYQQTCVEGQMSTVKQVKCGVPQGSILGSLLFICYINDLPLFCRQTKPYIYADDAALIYIYADDAALICIDNDPITVESKLQHVLDVLSEWFKVNKLSVNCAKTKCIMFCSKHSKYKDHRMSLKLNGEYIEHCNEIKYLGLILDKHLGFESHVAKLCSKVNARTKLLWRVRSFIPTNPARILYTALIHPHLGWNDSNSEGQNPGPAKQCALCSTEC